MNGNLPQAGEALTFEQVIERTKDDFNQTQKELKEIEVLIRQSSAEVEKLAQRNAQIANKLRQMEANIDSVPRQDIKEIYSAAQEAQMRLFMMRGQVEQLQGKQQHLERYANSLRQVLDVANKPSPTGGGKDSETEGFGGEGSIIVRIVNAQESERQRLARQMHDGPAQSLTNLILQAEICERLFDTDPVRARTELAGLKDAVTSTFKKVREFIFDLRPMMLDDLGLNPTLKRYVQDFESKSGLACNLTITGKEQRLPPHAEVTVFRVIQSLLNNVREHAHATHIEISLDLSPSHLKAGVEDDGSGFDVAEAMAAARQRKTMGIVTIMEQVELLGGEIQFDSSLGRGTKVQLNLPIQ
jgi:two-component system sensor histidine kinase DegS